VPQRKNFIVPQIREAEIVGLETIAARYVDAFRLLTMEHIRAFWRTKRKNIGGLPYNVKIPVKSNIERHLLKVKRVYKIQTQNIRSRMINGLTGIFTHDQRRLCAWVEGVNGHFVRREARAYATYFGFIKSIFSNKSRF
jgi:hypothetical protein